MKLWNFIGSGILNVIAEILNFVFFSMKLSRKLATKCQILPEKDAENLQNEYNQNFFGLFCRCKQEYEPKEGEAMLQCVVCFEWYHGDCLKPKVPETLALDANDLICANCLDNKVSFIKKYLSENKQWLHNYSGDFNEIKENLPNTGKRILEEICKNPEKGQKISKIEENKTDFMEKCLFKELQKEANLSNTDILLKMEWRDEVCKCAICLEMYKKLHLNFLFGEEAEELHNLLEYSEEIEPEEDPNKPAEPAKNKGIETLNENGLMDMLCRIGMNTLPADKQYYLVDGFRRIIDAFQAKFKDYSKEGKVITEEDVKELFKEIQKKDK